MKDPFDDDDVLDEAQTEVPDEVFDAPPAEAPQKPVATATVAVKPVLEDIEGVEQVRITFKSGAGYDVPWLTADFPSIDAAHEKLSDADRQNKLAEIFDIVARANKSFQTKVAKVSGGENKASNSNGQRRSNAPREAQEPPADAPPKPGEGWVYRSGKKKNGSGVWQAWFPPKGVDADPVWF